jgi:hypothetical protein
MFEELEASLNDKLPNGFEDFDDFADVVLSTISEDTGGEDWTIHPYHTGQREAPNDWGSRMIVGVEIELPHIKAKAIYNGFSWVVEDLD